MWSYLEWQSSYHEQNLMANGRTTLYVKVYKLNSNATQKNEPKQKWDGVVHMWVG
jgi:hypothetical protein